MSRAAELAAQRERVRVVSLRLAALLGYRAATRGLAVEQMRGCRAEVERRLALRYPTREALDAALGPAREVAAVRLRRRPVAAWDTPAEPDAAAVERAALRALGEAVALEVEAEARGEAAKATTPAGTTPAGTGTTPAGHAELVERGRAALAAAADAYTARQPARPRKGPR